MAEAPKSLTQLLTALADNTTGNISPEDIRDMLVSLYPARGQITHVPAATEVLNFPSTATYYPITIATEYDAAVSTSGVVMSGNGALQWTRPADMVLLVNATLSILPASNNKRYTFTFAKNGTPQDSLSYSEYYGNLGGNPNSVFLAGLMTVSENDIITVIARCDTDTTNLTISHFALSGLGVMT